MKWEEGDYEGSGEKGNYRWQMQPLGCQEVVSGSSTHGS